MNRIKTLILLMAFGGLGYGYYIPAKALLAQFLLQRAWSETQHGGSRVRPWPWADSWPVARMVVSRYGIDQIILQGDSGSSLAFAPGLRQAGLASQYLMISGHRDTHFRFLQHLRRGDAIHIIDATGRQALFRVSSTQVIDSRLDGRLSLDQASVLLLSTCYPFDAMRPGGPLRYLVVAVRDTTIMTYENTHPQYTGDHHV